MCFCTTVPLKLKLASSTHAQWLCHSWIARHAHKHTHSHSLIHVWLAVTFFWRLSECQRLAHRSFYCAPRLKKHVLWIDWTERTTHTFCHYFVDDELSSIFFWNGVFFAAFELRKKVRIFSHHFDHFILDRMWSFYRANTLSRMSHNAAICFSTVT